MSSVFGSNRPNTTKYSLKRLKLPFKMPKTYKNPYPHCLTPPLPLSTFQHFIIILLKKNNPQRRTPPPLAYPHRPTPSLLFTKCG